MTQKKYFVQSAVKRFYKNPKRTGIFPSLLHSVLFARTPAVRQTHFVVGLRISSAVQNLLYAFVGTDPSRLVLLELFLEVGNGGADVFGNVVRLIHGAAAVRGIMGV